jgi:hypothetical protein
MKATIIQRLRNNTIIVYCCKFGTNELQFIDLVDKHSGIIRKGAICVERVTGAAYREYGINYIETNS